jgi:hypothetical protein
MISRLGWVHGGGEGVIDDHEGLYIIWDLRKILTWLYNTQIGGRIAREALDVYSKKQCVWRSENHFR